MAHYLSLAEADALLPKLEQTMKRALELKHDFEEGAGVLDREARRILMAGGAQVDRDRMGDAKSLRDNAAVQLRKCIDDIEEIGAEVKDLDIGLADFRTLYRGEEVYLCWKLGETSITWWHGIDEGFRGRKPIDEDFRRNHRGARPS